MSTETAVPTPSDAELFRSSMTPEPTPAPAAPEAPAPAPAEATPQPPSPQQAEPAADRVPVRDEHGRFTGDYQDQPRQPQPQQAAAPQPPAPEDDKTPPSHRWKEMREEIAARDQRIREMEFALYDKAQRERAMQEQLARAQPQPQPQVPDPITDPQGYHQFMESRFNNNLRTMEQNFSFRLAHQQHGETFERAYGEMINRAERGDPAIVRAVMASPDPGQAMMNWYQQAVSLAQLGNHDPQTWARDVWLKDQLKDPKRAGEILELIRGSTAQAQPAQAGGGPVNLPPSLNRMAASAPVTAANGDMSDSSLFDFAFRQGRPPR